MHVVHHDISDVLSGLPEIDLLPESQPQCDVFIATIGFEDRSPYLITRFANAGWLRNSNVILIEYPTNLADNDKNRDAFLLAAKAAKNLHVLKYSKNDFMGRLQETLSYRVQGSIRNVLFDMSTCSSYVFYPTMSVLMEIDADLRLLYTEAGVYYPSEEEWKTVAREASLENTFFCESFENANFQTVGIRDVYVSRLFSEMNPGNRPSAFVGVPNFSAARMNALITRDQELNKTSSDNTYWIIGSPPNVRNQWRVEAIRQTNSLLHVNPSNIRFVSTLYYKEMLKALEEIWLNTKHNYHLSVGTLGSKMQHVGTYLFMCLHKDVGLLLAEPTAFQTASYSSGIGDIWQLKLGRTAKIRDLLSKYLTFDWSF